MIHSISCSERRAIPRLLRRLHGTKSRSLSVRRMQCVDVGLERHQALLTLVASRAPSHGRWALRKWSTRNCFLKLPQLDPRCHPLPYTTCCFPFPFHAHLQLGNSRRLEATPGLFVFCRHGLQALKVFLVCLRNYLHRASAPAVRHV